MKMRFYSLAMLMVSPILLHCMDNSFVKVRMDSPEVLANSGFLGLLMDSNDKTIGLKFGPKGKAVLNHALNNWHESSKRANVQTGLASIYNDTPATPAGVNSLIADQGTQKNASQYFATFNNSGYTQTKKVLENIAKSPYPKATQMADEASYKTALGIIYGSLHRTSDVHVPEDKMSQIFDDATSNMAHDEILRANKDIICNTKNKNAARGYLLLVAYLLQEGLLYRFTPQK